MFNWMKKKPVVAQDKIENPKLSTFSTDTIKLPSSERLRDFVNQRTFQRRIENDAIGTIGTMDSAGLKSTFQLGNSPISDAQLFWFASQGFIGYQACALIAQHWLVDKACSMPAQDAIRKGFEITSNNGEQIDPTQIDKIRQANIKYRLDYNLEQYVKMGRIFGIRIALFVVKSDDPQYYEKPFNIDGVKKNSYKGISQVDPYWITPELDADAASNPASIDFYEPTYWRVSGKRYHRSHLVIMRNGEVPDILKPTYFYGGLPLPQLIYERVYGAERTANEAPQLALTKRLQIFHTDITKAMAQQDVFEQKLQLSTFYRDNYGVRVIDLEETMEQFDLSLADLDAVIMTQYQLVAAVARVPATKLMGTSPKGFNTTGEFEEAMYHEELESLQTKHLTALIERHHQLLIKSEIAPENPFDTSIVWKPLDTMTAKEQAELNKTKAETGTALMSMGAIDSADERKRIIADPNSGYNGLSEEVPDDAEESLNSEPEEEDSESDYDDEK